MTKYETLGARIVIQARCRHAGVSVKNVLRRRAGYGGLTGLRARIADEIFGAGFSYLETGKLLNRNHSTVRTLVEGRKR